MEAEPHHANLMSLVACVTGSPIKVGALVTIMMRDKNTTSHNWHRPSSSSSSGGGGSGSSCLTHNKKTTKKNNHDNKSKACILSTHQQASKQTKHNTKNIPRIH